MTLRRAADAGRFIIDTFDDIAIMCINTHMNSRDVIFALKADGWFEVNQVGSHKQFKHLDKTGRVTVVHPSRDIPTGTLRSIEKQSGLKLK